ncbi:MAG: sugar ABC transporter permease [Chloroflexi bacterium]|nr:sugar ABC transporter permease [Chloroflexota bacterium]
MLALPGVLLILVLSYIPMFGSVLAFQDYSPRTGFLSPWVGLRNFRLLWSSPVAARIIRNTVILNVLFVTFTTLSSVLLAIALNEVRSSAFRRVAQSLMFLPFFMGWTIVGMLLYGIVDYEVGTLNVLLKSLGMERIVITSKPQWWPWLLTLIRIWKDTGSGCVIYLAALVGIDPQLYEAAAIDGAGRWSRIRHVSLPLLLPTIILLTLLSIGRIFYNDFGMMYALVGNKASLYPTVDVIETYIFRALQTNTDFGMSTAVGLSQSVLGFACILGSNLLARKYSQSRGETYHLF